MDPADVDAGQLVQCQAAGGKLVPLFVEQVVAEGLGHAGPAVVRRTATDADDEVTRAGVVGVLQQLTDPIRGRNARVALLGWHQRETGCLRHFDHGRRALIDQSVGGIDGIAEWPSDPQAPVLAMGGGDQCLDGAVTAVGNRQQDQLDIGSSNLDSLGDRLGGLQRGERALEGIGRDHDAHQRAACCRRASARL